MKQWQRVMYWVGYTGIVGWFGFGYKGWLFGLGVGLALGLLLIDRLIYVWWLYPFEQSSLQVQYWAKQKDIKACLGLLCRPGFGRSKLVLKQRLVGLAWPLLAIFSISSTGNVLMVGMVMGLGLSLVETAATLWRNKILLGLMGGTWGLFSLALLV